jgi:thiamine kinase-like enzyme
LGGFPDSEGFGLVDASHPVRVAGAVVQLVGDLGLGFVPSYATVNHGDNQPRNWLVDDTGTIRLIDFGRAGIDAWIRDIDRMYFAEWAADPDLEDAFFDGYGSQGLGKVT